MAKASVITGKGNYLMNTRNSQFIVYWKGRGCSCCCLGLVLKFVGLGSIVNVYIVYVWFHI